VNGVEDVARLHVLGEGAGDTERQQSSSWRRLMASRSSNRVRSTDVGVGARCCMLPERDVFVIVDARFVSQVDALVCVRLTVFTVWG
jgi:hypothetical protein